MPSHLVAAVTATVYLPQQIVVPGAYPIEDMRKNIDSLLK
jgi:hypothetical protein